MRCTQPSVTMASALEVATTRHTATTTTSGSTWMTRKWRTSLTHSQWPPSKTPMSSSTSKKTHHTGLAATQPPLSAPNTPHACEGDEIATKKAHCSSTILPQAHTPTKNTDRHAHTHRACRDRICPEYTCRPGEEHRRSRQKPSQERSVSFTLPAFLCSLVQCQPLYPSQPTNS